jgi:hypothetical protein
MEDKHPDFALGLLAYNRPEAYGYLPGPEWNERMRLV